MAAISANRPLRDLQRQLAELRFCRAELKSRCDAAAHPAWLWEMKHRVADYCLHRLEQSADVTASEAVPLSTTDEGLLRRTHPLFRNRLPGQAFGLPDRAWAEEIRHKVRSYVRAVAGDPSETEQT